MIGGTNFRIRLERVSGTNVVSENFKKPGGLNEISG